MKNRRRIQNTAPEPTVGIGVKLTRLVSKQEQVKIAYHQLKSQITIGLAEAEEVFASLAIPLMKLVGLKTYEMTEEGRLSTIFVDDDFFPEFCRNGPIPESPVISPTVNGGERKNKIQRKGESFTAAKAMIASREFFEKQQTQVLQLVHLLKEVEKQVNSHQDDILQRLSTQRGSLQKLFKKACYILYTHNENHDAFGITVKLLQALVYRTDAILGSVEDGMQGLMQDLAERMCNPMVKYVKGQQADLEIGTGARLLAVVDEMERSMRNGRFELEEARKRVKEAEEGRIMALCKLKESEENLRRMQEYQKFLVEIQKEHIEHLVSRKFLGMEEAEPKETNLVWELQRKMRKLRTPGSPLGPNELLYFESNKKHHPTRTRTSFSPGLVTRSHMQALSPQTPRLETRIPLGSSPSLAVQQVVSRKRNSPHLLNP